MVLRLLTASAEHWLGNRLNDYLRDNNEYRAITRNLLHLGGTVSYTRAAITVTLGQPAAPRIARALGLVLDEINTTPPPHARRPPAHHLPAHTPGQGDARSRFTRSVAAVFPSASLSAWLLLARS